MERGGGGGERESEGEGGREVEVEVVVDPKRESWQAEGPRLLRADQICTGTAHLSVRESREQSRGRHKRDRIGRRGGIGSGLRRKGGREGETRKEKK